MNLFPVNGALLGGSRLATVAAAAVFACSSSVGAYATRVQDALAPTPTGAQLTAQPTHIQSASAEFFACRALIQALPTHYQAAESRIGAWAEVSAYVLRTISGAAFATGTAHLEAIPASTLGSAEVDAGAADLIADATKVHPGHAGLDSTATVTLQAEPTVVRYVQAQLVGAGAQLYGEVAINGAGEAYARFTAEADLRAAGYGLVQRPARAVIAASALCTADPAHVIRSRAAPMALGLLVSADPHIQIGGLVFAATQAQVAASATRVVKPETGFSGSVSVVAAPSVRHGSAKAQVTGTSATSASGVRGLTAQVSMASSATLTASAERLLQPEGFVGATAAVETFALRSCAGESWLEARAAQLIAAPDVTVRDGAAILHPAQAELAVGATRWLWATAPILGAAEVDAFGVRELWGEATTTGGAHFLADSIANPYSVDPDERYFVRPGQADFVRPAQGTDFRRYA